MKRSTNTEWTLFEGIRATIEVGRLPAGEVSVAMERAAPAELKFWINGEPANGGTVRRTAPTTFTASETFDVA